MNSLLEQVSKTWFDSRGCQRQQSDLRKEDFATQYLFTLRKKTGHIIVRFATLDSKYLVKSCRQEKLRFIC